MAAVARDGLNDRTPNPKRFGVISFSGQVAALAALLVVVGACDRPPAPTGQGGAAHVHGVDASGRLRYHVRPRGQTPVVSFEFPEPLSGYRGEATDVSGKLTIDESLRAASLRGFVEVRTASVTLGDPEMDENAHSAMFMNVEKHPLSRFEITGVEEPSGDGAAVGTGGPTSCVMLGDFTLKGITVPVRVEAALMVADPQDARGDGGSDPSSLPPVSSAPPAPRELILTARWELNILKPFGIPGPSDEPAGERVLFRAELRLGLEKS